MKEVDWTKPIKQRGGKNTVEERGIVMSEGGTQKDRLIVVTDENGGQDYYTVDDVTGEKFLDGHPSDADIINGSTEHEIVFRVNIYIGEDGKVNLHRTFLHETKDKADQQACRDRIACPEVRIKFFEGEGLECE